MESNDLEPAIPPSEREALATVGDRLDRERPAPSPRFRGDLGRRLLATRWRTPSPAGRFRVLAGSYVVLGVLCLVVAAGGLAGVGPFAT